MKTTSGSGVRRLRPNNLTSVTTVAGLLPLLLETSFQAQLLIPMAVSLCFGLMVTSVLILLLVPTFYLAYTIACGQLKHSCIPLISGAACDNASSMRYLSQQIDNFALRHTGLGSRRERHVAPGRHQAPGLFQRFSSIDMALKNVDPIGNTVWATEITHCIFAALIFHSEHFTKGNRQ